MSEPPVIDAKGLSTKAKQRGAVLITGRGTEIAFHLDENAPLRAVVRELDVQLAGKSALFSKGGISVNTGNRSLSDDERAEIQRIFREKSGLKISRFVSSTGQDADDPGQEPEAQDEPQVRQRRSSSTPLPQFSSAELARALSSISPQGQRQRDQALVVRGTVRSGELVQHPGDIVVLGDVNPGAEVTADGDIVVMGALHGLPHAGASGDSKAAIIALDIAAARLRISSCHADAPASKQWRGAAGNKADTSPMKPKIAYVRHEAILVSPFTGRFARYTKGVPYEG